MECGRGGRRRGAAQQRVSLEAQHPSTRRPLVEAGLTRGTRLVNWSGSKGPWNPFLHLFSPSLWPLLHFQPPLLKNPASCHPKPEPA